MDVYLALAMIVGAYLVGSIPTSYLIGRLAKNVDIRERGSKNIGASNLASQVGAWWVVPVAPFDVFIKGALPVLIASEKILGLGIGIEVASGLAGIIGHNWSIFSGFKGGRGMATVFGATLAINFPLLIVYASIPTLGVHFTPWKDSAAWCGDSHAGLGSTIKLAYGNCMVRIGVCSDNHYQENHIKLP